MRTPRLSVPEEAIQKAGGSQQQLDIAIRCGRVVRAQVGQIWMYFFPRREYSKETLVKQSIGAEEVRGGDGEAFDKMEDNMFSEFQWDPESLVPSSLGSNGQINMLMVPTSSSSAAQSLPMTTPTEAGVFSVFLFLSGLVGALF